MFEALRNKLHVLFRVFSTTERVVFVLLSGIAVISAALLLGYAWQSVTIEIPAHGGTYREGIIGELRTINPILAPVNDADRDTVFLVFDGLMRVNGAGTIVPALAGNYAIGDHGKIYEFTLRENLFWHDGEPITADDVVFTINRIQDPSFRSPLRDVWAGVTVEALDEQHIRFTLPGPYASFLANTTVGILPRHIWAPISSSKFTLAEENIRAVGSGPYLITKFERNRRGTIRSVTLRAFDRYYEGTPFIETVTLVFYPNEEAMIAGYNIGEIDGLNLISPNNIALLRNAGAVTVTDVRLPRYMALFFNQSRSAALSDDTVRTALAHATDKNGIVEQALSGKGTTAHSAIPPGLFGYTDDIPLYPYDPDRARNLLHQAGWVLGEELEIRQEAASEEDKDESEQQNEELDPTLFYKPGSDDAPPTPLALEITTSNWPELITVAQMIADQWRAVGIQTTVTNKTVAEIQEDVIRPRQYQVLLFGQILGVDPDPFSFWHSSQKKDPGLNLALYDNRDVDKLLETARQTLNPEERANAYRSFQQHIAKDIPAIFLYVPPYLYAPGKNIKGIDISLLSLPSDRFSEIHRWYIETKRRRR